MDPPSARIGIELLQIINDFLPLGEEFDAILLRARNKGVPAGDGIAGRFRVMLIRSGLSVQERCKDLVVPIGVILF